VSKIEGKLEFKDDCLFIDQTPVGPGLIIEVNVDGQWVELCIERTLSVYYSIPSFDLFIGHTARMDE